MITALPQPPRRSSAPKGLTSTEAAARLRSEAGAFLAASGAAFAAVVIGQAANAFACCSTTELPGALGWTTNRLLLWRIAIELLLLAGFLFVGPVASVLGQAPPSAEGWLVAVLAAPAVLAVDALHKTFRLRRPPAAGATGMA